MCQQFAGVLFFTRASLVAQLVKNLPAMQETWVRSLGSEDPLEKGKATHSSILTRRGVSKSQTQLSDFHFTYNIQQFSSANPKLPCGAAKKKGKKNPTKYKHKI